MMTNIFHKLTMGSAMLCSLLTAGLLFTSCSEVEYETSASDVLATVSNLTYENPAGTRNVTLRWQNPAGIKGIQIIRDNADVIELKNVVDNYFIKKAPTNVDVAYTVKARYTDSLVSKGQTIRFHLNYELKRGSKVAMLVPDDYAEGSADEKAAVEWFKKTYVTNGIGVLVTPATIDDLDIADQGTCWVICDRCGLKAGWSNLPGNLAANETITALKSFANDGGNLLLTNHATQLTVALGRLGETYTPNIFGAGDGGPNPDVWGVHPIIGNVEGQIYDHKDHAIYKDMTYEPTMYAGIYCFESAGVKGDHNCMWDMNAISELTENPNKIADFESKTNSTVLGTWNHVVDYCCAGIVDFNPTTTMKARILAVGLAAYEWDLGGTANEKQDQLELFTKNCIEYLK